MAGWNDIGGGEFEITPTIVVSTENFEKFEQIRKSINFLYFTTGSQMSDEEFVTFLIEGKISDRIEEELNGKLIQPQFSFPRLWIEFKKFWVDRKTRTIDSTTNGDTEALAIVVDAPPAA